MALWHQAHSDECFFQLLFPGLSPVSLLENESGLEIVTQLVDTGKQPCSRGSLIFFKWINWLLVRSLFLDVSAERWVSFFFFEWATFYFVIFIFPGENWEERPEAAGLRQQQARARGAAVQHQEAGRAQDFQGQGAAGGVAQELRGSQLGAAPGAPRPLRLPHPVPGVKLPDHLRCRGSLSQRMLQGNK